MTGDDHVDDGQMSRAADRDGLEKNLCDDYQVDECQHDELAGFLPLFSLMSSSSSGLTRGSSVLYKPLIFLDSRVKPENDILRQSVSRE